MSRLRHTRSRQRLVALAVVVAAVLIAGGLAILVTGPDAEKATSNVEVAGEALPPLPDNGIDPVVSQSAPVAAGQDYDGRPVTVGEPDAAVQVVLFVAHWCPACRQEVPQVQQAVEDGALPDEVELVAVSTAVQPGRDGYPPDAWFAEAGWQVPTLADDGEGAVLAAYSGGQPAFPTGSFSTPAGGSPVATSACCPSTRWLTSWASWPGREPHVGADSSPRPRRARGRAGDVVVAWAARRQRGDRGGGDRRRRCCGRAVG